MARRRPENTHEFRLLRRCRRVMLAASSSHPDPQQTSRPRWKALRSPLLNAETPSSRLSLTGCNPLQAEWATGKGTFVRTFSVRARHQPDFEWRAERESCTVNPVQEYAPIRAELCDQASLAACGARCGSESVTLSAPAVVAIGVDAGDKRLPKRRILGWSCRPTPFMRTLRWSFAGATERVRVRGVSTRGATVTFSYRLAGALRPIPVEPSEEKCHNDRACGRTHPCRSEA